MFRRRALPASLLAETPGGQTASNRIKATVFKIGDEIAVRVPDYLRVGPEDL